MFDVERLRVPVSLEETRERLLEIVGMYACCPAVDNRVVLSQSAEVAPSGIQQRAAAVCAAGP